MNQPAWIEVLRTECQRTSQSQAADRIGYSTAVVNQVLKGTYKGDLSRVEEAVKGALMGATIDCPEIGDIPRNRCIEYQRRSGTSAATNPLRIRLAKACPVCDFKESRS